MDGIDSTNPTSSQVTGTSRPPGPEVPNPSEEGSTDGQIATDEQIVEAWTPVAQMVIQGALLHLFPEARRIQQRTEQFNKEMMRDN